MTKSIRISAEMKARIAEAAALTWEAIGPDVLMSIGCEDTSGGSISGREVAEFVADHIEIHGEDQEAVEFWREVPAGRRMALIKAAFPHRRYGW